MNEDTITDLKQFIAATFKQESAGLEDRLSRKIDTVVGSAKDEILGAVAKPH